MLSLTQRERIRSGIETMVDAITTSTTLLPERQIIKNVDDFPLVQITFLTEGNRQCYWRDQLHEAQDPVTKEWQTYYGNRSRATISVALESLDLEELHGIAAEFALLLWQNNWSWAQDKLEFLGSDPPRFHPLYIEEAAAGRKGIYKCTIDFWIDYEFSWPITAPPITNFAFSNTIADSTSTIDLVCTAPGVYLISGNISGGPVVYSFSGTIAE